MLPPRNINIFLNYFTVQEENWEIANELLNRGADPNLTTHEGATCMHMAAAVGSIEWVNKYVQGVNSMNVLCE